jgi:hypothetical protein
MVKGLIRVHPTPWHEQLSSAMGHDVVAADSSTVVTVDEAQHAAQLVQYANDLGDSMFPDGRGSII